MPEATPELADLTDEEQVAALEQTDNSGPPDGIELPQEPGSVVDA